MTSLSPANAERLKLAFQECRDMEGTLNERLEAYAAAGREFFPAYGEAVDRLVARIHENGGGENAPQPGDPMPPFILPDETGRLINLNSLLEKGPEEFAEKFKSDAHAPFPVLTDLDNGYALSLNLAIWLGTEIQQLLSYQDLSDFHGNDGWVLPIPATFVVGRDGLVKARFVDPDFRRRMEIDDLVAALASASRDR